MSKITFITTLRVDNIQNCVMQFVQQNSEYKPDDKLAYRLPGEVSGGVEKITLILNEDLTEEFVVIPSPQFCSNSQKYASKLTKMDMAGWTPMI